MGVCFAWALLFSSLSFSFSLSSSHTRAIACTSRSSASCPTHAYPARTGCKHVSRYMVNVRTHVSVRACVWAQLQVCPLPEHSPMHMSYVYLCACRYTHPYASLYTCLYSCLFFMSIRMSKHMSIHCVPACCVVPHQGLVRASTAHRSAPAAS